MATATWIVPEARLGTVGPPLGEPGGQGTVHGLPDHPGWVYKRYHDHITVDPDGLVALVRWRKSHLTGRDRKIVDVRTAWPELVVERDSGHGIVVRRASRRFSHSAAGVRVDTDLQFACMREAAWSGTGPAGPRAAIAIVYRYAQVLDVLHRHSVVYGDLSYRNMFWSSAPGRPRIFLIDCDAAWLTTAPRGVPAGETKPWTDPWPNDGSPERARRADQFKLAQLFARAYYHWPNEIEPATQSLELAAAPPVTARLTDLLARGLRSDERDEERPAAQEWLQPLHRLDLLLRARGTA